LIKREIKATFRNNFTGRRDNTERDAAEAVAMDTYGATAGREEVKGWGWAARRLRASHLQRAVDAGRLN
jgi:hypothetical protein